MAQLTPAAAPPLATSGEKVLSNILAALPDDVIVYRDINLKDQYPDFVVVSPRLGILIIEIKDWKSMTIISANRDTVELHLFSRSKTVSHPVKQAREYAFALRKEIESRVDGQIFLKKDGPYKGNICFPISYLAILSEISNWDLEKLNLANVFDPARTLTKDWLRMAQSMRGGKLEKALESYFRPKFRFSTLNEIQMNKLRAIIYPHFVVSEPVRLDFIRPIVMRAINTSKSWDMFAEKLAANDLEYFERGGGLAVRSIASGDIICKASAVGPGYSMLMRIFQCPFPGHSHTWLTEKVLGIKH